MFEPMPFENIVENFYINFINSNPNCIWSFHNNCSYVYDRFFCYSVIAGQFIETPNGCGYVMFVSDDALGKPLRGRYLSLLTQMSPFPVIRVPTKKNSREIDLSFAVIALKVELENLIVLNRFSKRNKVAFQKAFESLSLIDYYVQEIPNIDKYQAVDAFLKGGEYYEPPTRDTLLCRLSETDLQAFFRAGKRVG